MIVNQPLYRTIADALKKEIEEKRYEKGSLLPTESKLKETFHVSRVTIRQALQLLVDEGYVKKIQGSGTFVIYSRHAQILNRSSKIIPFSQEMRLIGKKPSAQVTNFELIHATKQVAEELELEDESLLFFYERILCGDNYPYCSETGFMPLKYFPDFNLTHIADSKINYVQKEKNFTIEYSQQIVHALTANQKLSERLQVPLNTPLLEVTHITYDKKERPIMKAAVTFDSTVYQAHFIKYKC